jgi:hypothetical protein
MRRRKGNGMRLELFLTEQFRRGAQLILGLESGESGPQREGHWMTRRMQLQMTIDDRL